MKALRIDFHPQSGIRPAGINVRKPGYPSASGWQDSKAGVEIRMVINGDVGRFRDVEGIEILEGPEAIDAAVALLNPSTGDQYVVTNEGLMGACITAQEVPVWDMAAELDHNSELEWLYKKGVSGIVKIEKPEPAKATDVAKGWQAKD